MVTMGYAAHATKRINFVTGIVILPQRQAVLVAKQAAQVDVLSGGRLRLGIGSGWNPVEYEALGMDFAARGKMMDEQIDVMRQLWCNELVTYRGKWHTIADAGINPLPVQQPIPIWMGGWSEPVIKRLAKKGDGWLLYCDLELDGKPAIAKLHKQCEAVGRNPAEIGIQGWVIVNKCNVAAGERQKPGAAELRSPEEWLRDARAWKAAGATHLECWTTWGNLHTVDEHVKLAGRFLEVMSGL